MQESTRVGRDWLSERHVTWIIDPGLVAWFNISYRSISDFSRTLVAITLCFFQQFPAHPPYVGSSDLFLVFVISCA